MQAERGAAEQARPERHVPPRWLSQGAERLVERIGAGSGAQPLRVDVVIVGSGYGGAVAAARLAGLAPDHDLANPIEVIVLERGDEFVPGAFPDRFSQTLPHIRAERRSEKIEPTLDDTRTGLDHALFDFRIGARVSALVGNGLGGGSLINAGVVEAPPGEVFQQPQWPRAIRQEAATAPWEAHFRRAATALGAAPWTTAVPKTTALFAHTAALQAHVGQRIAKVRPAIAVSQAAGVNSHGVTQAACIACGNCVSGCNHWAKNTLPMNYLATARQRGAKLYTGATVVAVCASNDQAEPGWIIRFRLTHDRRERNLPDTLHDVYARHVVLAAGTYGTAQILRQSALTRGSRLEHLASADSDLGKGFSCNGDGIAAAYDQTRLTQPVEGVGCDPTIDDARPGQVGPTITGMLDVRNWREPDDRFVIQDAAIPFALARLYEEVLMSFGAVRRMMHWNDRTAASTALDDPLGASAARLQHTQFFLLVGHDAADWKLEFQRTESVDGAGASAVPVVVASVESPPRSGAKALRERQTEINRAVETLADAKAGGGGLCIPNPLWEPAPPELLEALRAKQPGSDADADPLAAERLVTVHPLGGCRMADDAAHGVVNHLGQVFRGPSGEAVFANLVVMDGSIVCGSLGINPLLTIAALAERACEKLAAQWHLVASTASLQPLPKQPLPVRALEWKPIPTTVMFNETMDGPLELFVNRKAQLATLARPVREQALDARAQLTVRAPIADLWGLVADPEHAINVALADLQIFWRGSENGLAPLLLQPPPAAPEGSQPKPLVKWMSIRVRLMHLLPSQRDERIWRALRHWWATRGRAFLYEEVSFVPFRALAAGALIWLLSADSGRIRDWLRGSLEWVAETFGFGKALVVMAKIASHHGEARAMTYELPDLDPADTPFSGPVKVLAAKRIHYGMSPGYQQRPTMGRPNPKLPKKVPSTPWRAVAELQVLMLSATEGRALRDCDWPRDQRPDWLKAGKFRVVARGKWTLRLETMLGQDVPQLVAYQTLPDAWLDMVSLSTFFARALLQGYFWSFRLPAYPKPLKFGGQDLGPLPGFVLGANGQYVEQPGRGKTWDQHVLTLPVPPPPPGSPLREGAPTVVLTNFRPVKGAPKRHHPVVMLHAFVTSGYQFATPRLKTNAVQYLTRQGFDVWVVDLRTSIAVASSHDAWDFDVVARKDIPAAVDEVLTRTGAKQVHVVAHCMGSAAFNMAVLGNHLGAGAQSRVRSSVQTQVSMDLVSTPPNRLKASAIRFLEDMFEAEELKVTADTDALQGGRIAETLGDRLLMTWPLNDIDALVQLDNELWKPRKTFVATVNRINLLYGRNFSHAYLSDDMRNHLHEVFRHANVRAFRHVLQFHRAGRVVDYEGSDAYVRDPHIRERYDFPVCFLYGQFAAVFGPATTRRSKIRLDTLLPDQVHERHVLRAPVGADGIPLRPNWGHFDIWLSERSAKEVFPRVAQFLSDHDGPTPPPTAPRTAPRFLYEAPSLGPWLGWWRADPAAPGHALARIWFRTPFRDVAHVEAAVFSAPADATVQTSLTQIWPWTPCPLTEGCAVIEASFTRPSVQLGIVVICRSPQATWFDEPDPARRPPQMGQWFRIDRLAGDVIDVVVAPLLQASTPFRGLGSHAPRWLDGKLDWQLPQDVIDAIGAVSDPPEVAPPLPLPLPPPPPTKNELLAAAAGMPPIEIGPALFNQLDPASLRLQFLLASCRYQATEMEELTANRSLGDVTTASFKQRQFDLALLVGDQIYADASYGVLDGRPSLARLNSKYTSVFTGSVGTLGRKVPLYLCGDDHEIRDDWFVGVRTNAEQEANDGNGFAMMDAYQYLAMPPRLQGRRDYQFTSAGFAFHVLDDRFERGAPGTFIWSAAQRAALAAFLLRVGQADPTRPVFVVSSLPVLPFEIGLGEVEDIARGDGWQSYPASLAELLRAILASSCEFVVFLAGDRHLSHHARGMLSQGARSVRLESIVSSGLNAPIPFANKNVGDMIQTHRGSVAGLAGVTLDYDIVAASTADGWADVEVGLNAAGAWTVRSAFR